jgi:very-short-patch-repair endonuclease
VLHSADPALYKMLEQKAKDMRANPTKAEKRLWEKLNNKQLGVKFRQQHVVNKFIVDFCSIKKALIIEVDGEIHNSQQEADTERTAILKNEGYSVIRFTNDEVLNNIEDVLSAIQKAINTAPSPLKGEQFTDPKMSKSPSGDLGAYKDIKGFCNSASIERVRELDYVLTPGRYVGLPDDEDDFDFMERFTQLKAEFEGQLQEEERLNQLILENLGRVQIKNE